MSEIRFSHGYSKAALKELQRLPRKARKDICTIVPILTHDMVQEACTARQKMSEGARVLREAGISQIAHNLYRLETDETHSIICKFAQKKCAILAITQKEALI